VTQSSSSAPRSASGPAEAQSADGAAPTGAAECGRPADSSVAASLSAVGGGDGAGATLEGVAPTGGVGTHTPVGELAFVVSDEARGVDLVVAFSALTRYVVAEESFG